MKFERIIKMSHCLRLQSVTEFANHQSSSSGKQKERTRLHSSRTFSVNSAAQAMQFSEKP